ncbi:hypothetical protein Y88_0089 [Novosphingobium nitrogenifigens DSM 19370]|uniref:Uncharacterized protein n=1 Tax=Novosphingobium nitrogenifigens DSM 19370 TaxID=983920 RepID=F1ZBH6_9SPHN|nr:hypothetical protein [Novosphingobium nitrogenifigens]EGD58037.1 hypothetical protein Y88_0089 [Novosphingobium nitrogenifigens DSM 19370]
MVIWESEKPAMLPVLSAALAFAPLTLAGAMVPDDPLAPSDKGMVQCYQPDTSGHTCQSIAAYRRNRDGTFANTATVMPDPTQPLTLETVTTVVVRNGEVCGTLSRDAVLGGKLWFFGRPVPEDHAVPLLDQISGTYTGIFDREICTTYIPTPGGFIAKGRMVGNPHPFPAQRMIWIRADAGYRVAPAGSPANQG